MNVEQKVERLRAMVEAAFREFDFVARLYETWHPAAYDQDLFDRMGPSYASHAFNLIREALAREIVIGLTKLWDRDDRSIRMDEVGDIIRSPGVIRVLAAELARRRGSEDYQAMMETDLAKKAEAALAIIDRYKGKGSHRRIRDGLSDIRNKRFVHKLVTADPFPAGSLCPDDPESTDHLGSRSGPRDLRRLVPHNADNRRRCGDSAPPTKAPARSRRQQNATATCPAYR